MEKKAKFLEMDPRWKIQVNCIKECKIRLGDDQIFLVRAKVNCITKEEDRKLFFEVTRMLITERSIRSIPSAVLGEK